MGRVSKLNHCCYCDDKIPNVNRNQSFCDVDCEKAYNQLLKSNTNIPEKDWLGNKNYLKKEIIT